MRDCSTAIEGRGQPVRTGEPVKLTDRSWTGCGKTRKKWIGAGGLESADDPAPARAADQKELDDLRQNPANLPGLKTTKSQERGDTKTTPFDLGPFRQRVELKAEVGEPVVVLVSGAIQGDLGPENPNAIRLISEVRPNGRGGFAPLVLESEADVMRWRWTGSGRPIFSTWTCPMGRDGTAAQALGAAIEVGPKARPRASFPRRGRVSRQRRLHPAGVREDRRSSAAVSSHSGAREGGRSPDLAPPQGGRP